MKTVREIFDAKTSSFSSVKGFAVFSTKEIDEIQSDARAQGMTDAADISANRYADPEWNGLYRNAGDAIQYAILAARDAKTTL
jgi:hypothetical protein